jgi:hypothetical protein
MVTAAYDRDISIMGLFSKSKEVKSDDFYDEWNRFNLIARMMQDVFRERRSATDVVKSVQSGIETLTQNFAMSGQSERMIFVLSEGIIRNGKELTTELYKNYGKSMDTMDFSNELIKLYDDSMKKVLAYINEGVVPDGFTHDTVLDLVEYTNEEFKKGQLFYIGETDQF